MPETRPPIDLNGVSLDELQALLDGRRRPPVEQWDPPHCGDSHIRIARDGTWFHEGRPLLRPAMVRLFSTILRREPDGTHLLVTPVEKLTVEVESTAFRAIALHTEGTGAERRIAVQIDGDDAVVVGPDHPLTLVDTAAGPSPRVAVRHGLEAELTRPVFYELAEIAISEGGVPPGVWSDGVFFPLEAAG